MARHDRGCYVAMRLALDHPDAVSRVVLMDGIPITEALARCDEDFARSWFHWFFYAVPEKPERAINSDPLAWPTHDPKSMGAENHAEWVEAVTNPETVRAMLEDYRAGLTVDAELERQDREAGRRITCPALICGRAKTTYKDNTATPSRSGASGAARFEGCPSTQRITRPRRTRLR